MSMKVVAGRAGRSSEGGIGSGVCLQVEERAEWLNHAGHYSRYARRNFCLRHGDKRRLLPIVRMGRNKVYAEEEPHHS